jgi:hypothetical protein
MLLPSNMQSEDVKSRQGKLRKLAMIDIYIVIISVNQIVQNFLQHFIRLRWLQTVLYSTVRWLQTVLYNTVQYCTVQYSTMVAD